MPVFSATSGPAKVNMSASLQHVFVAYANVWKHYIPKHKARAICLVHRPLLKGLFGEVQIGSRLPKLNFALLDAGPMLQRRQNRRKMTSALHLQRQGQVREHIPQRTKRSEQNSFGRHERLLSIPSAA